MSTTSRWSEAELMALPEDGLKRQLVDGEIVVSPAGAAHGRIIVRLIARLELHVTARGLGSVFDSSTGCWMPSGNLRVPDASFVARDRLPDGVPDGFLRVVPDLVAEVLSPGDSPRLVLDKVGEHLASGVRMIWVIDPAARSAASHRSLTDLRMIAEAEDGHLDGEDVLPDFRCRLGELLG